MGKSPGHQRWPDHHVNERPVKGRMSASVNGETLADSTDVILVEEDKHPVRYYFPRSDLKMAKLQPSATTSECPFKGTARYFNVLADGQQLQDAAWSYEDPYEEHADLAGRVAFYDEKLPQIEIKAT